MWTCICTHPETHEVWNCTLHLSSSLSRIEGQNRTKIRNTFNANLKYQTTNIRWLWDSHAPINDFRFAGKKTKNKIESRKSSPNACVFYFLFWGALLLHTLAPKQLEDRFSKKVPVSECGKFQVSVFWPKKGYSHETVLFRLVINAPTIHRFRTVYCTVLSVLCGTVPVHQTSLPMLIYNHGFRVCDWTNDMVWCSIFSRMANMYSLYT